MKKRKKMLAALLAALTLLASAQAALAAEPDYLTRGEAAEMLLAAADDYNPGVKKTDILHGYADGNLHEEGSVSRAQALVMLERAFGGLPAPQGAYALTAYDASQFTDVPDWAAGELESVLKSGIVAGTSAETFDPGAPVTRSQMERFIRRTYALKGSNLKDDFYAAVNRDFLTTAVLQPGYPDAGVFTDLGLRASADAAAIIREIAASGGKNEGEQKVAALYNNILDWDSRNAAGITPIKPYLDDIDSATTLKELLAADARMGRELGGRMLLGFGLTTDLKNSDVYTVTFSTITPSLGQSGYSDATDTQKDAYIAYMTALLTIAGQPQAEARRQAQVCWDTESALADVMLTAQEAYDVDKTYNIYTMDQLQRLFPQVDLRSVFADTGLRDTGKIGVTDVKLMEANAALFKDSNLDTLKIMARFALLSAMGSTLSRDFIDASDAFQAAFYGTSETAPYEDTAAQYVQNLLSEYLGEAYVSRHFSSAAKDGAEALVKDLIEVYRQRIRQLDWMSAATKEKAIRKLDTMAIHIGYPDQWDGELEDTPILPASQGGSFFQNIVEIQKTYRALLPKLQNEPVDKDEWLMTPYTVNACYMDTTNTIEFPAAILQPPYYDVNASYEQNLGGIGYVIAHEITHAFDNNGAKYDENGNAADWWTAADYDAFQKLCGNVAEFYDGQEAFPGVTCNGSLTLSENIADLGAVACITQAASRRTAPDYETLYRSAAAVWAEAVTRDYGTYLAKADVHAPSKLRGNLPLQTCDQFYKTFGIEEGDGMWVAPQNRVSIW